MDTLQPNIRTGFTPLAFFKEIFFALIHNNLTVRPDFHLNPFQRPWCGTLKINALHGEPTAVAGTFVFVLSF